MTVSTASLLHSLLYECVQQFVSTVSHIPIGHYMFKGSRAFYCFSMYIAEGQDMPGLESSRHIANASQQEQHCQRCETQLISHKLPWQASSVMPQRIP